MEFPSVIKLMNKSRSFTKKEKKGIKQETRSVN